MINRNLQRNCTALRNYALKKGIKSDYNGEVVSKITIDENTSVIAWCEKDDIRITSIEYGDKVIRTIQGFLLIPYAYEGEKFDVHELIPLRDFKEELDRVVKIIKPVL